MTSARVCLIALLLSFSMLSAIRYIPDSAFNPEIQNGLKPSLLNLPLSAEEDSIHIYGAGLSLPFIPLTQVGDAAVDLFRCQNKKHSLLSYQSPDAKLNAELNFTAGLEPVKKEESYSFLYGGLVLKSKYGKHWEMNTNWWNGIFLGNQQEAINSWLVDGYSNPNDDQLNIDNLSGDISYNANNLTLALGRGKFPVGNSISGSINLNDEVNDYGYFMAEGRSGIFSVSFMHASLMADSTYNIYNDHFYNSKNYPAKYLALHQLGIHPCSGLNLFLGEEIIYGNRSPEISYFLPVAFWRAIEHNLWDRDNVMIFAGGSYRPVQPLFLYAQALVDEFSFSKMFSDWWGNKYALQGGMRWTTPFALPKSSSAEITTELSAVRPFTYTHYLNHTMFSTDGRTLGYPKGSNLVDLSCLLSLPYQTMLLWQGGISYCKQGSFGSDFSQNYHDVFPTAEAMDNGTAHWFEGTKTETLTLKSNVLITIFAHHRFLLGLETSHSDDWQNTLYSAWQFIY
ncbi:MAG: hypothetical protein ABFC98_03400 [Candidatus Cloacimonas sp.]